MKSFNYPEQNGVYAVRVKNGAKWREYRDARLQISVGGDRHEGEKFNATIDWVKNRFDKTIICVNDTLQRYNYISKGMAPDRAYEETLKAGDRWLDRNLAAIEKLPNYELHRWNEWLKDPSYQSVFDSVVDLYNSDEAFQDAIYESQKNKWSKEYLLEEIAVFSLMYRYHNAVDIYPGTMPEAMNIFQNQHTTRIDFARKRAA